MLAVLVLAAFLPSVALAGTGFSLSRDGRVHRASPCCAGMKHRAAPAPLTSATLRAECCALTSSDAVSPPAASHDVKPPPSLDLVAVVLAEPPVPMISARALAAPWTIEPRPPDRSLFASHCALLL